MKPLTINPTSDLIFLYLHRIEYTDVSFSATHKTF